MFYSSKYWLQMGKKQFSQYSTWSLETWQVQESLRTSQMIPTLLMKRVFLLKYNIGTILTNNVMIQLQRF